VIYQKGKRRSIYSIWRPMRGARGKNWKMILEEKEVPEGEEKRP